MVDHLQKKHKLKKTTKEYKEALFNSKVVPSCFVTCKDGIMKMLDGERLIEAKRKYKCVVSSQKESQGKMKKLRIETNDKKQ